MHCMASEPLTVYFAQTTVCKKAIYKRARFLYNEAQKKERVLCAVRFKSTLLCRNRMR